MSEADRKELKRKLRALCVDCDTCWKGGGSVAKCKRCDTPSQIRALRTAINNG